MVKFACCTKDYILILLVCFFAFFINNGAIPADLMESRNLATAQEIVNSGNYLIPTLNGELRLEKPPLPTWIAAAIENVFPDNLVVQRYAAGFMASMMVLFIYLLGRRLTQRREFGLIAALVLASTFNIVMMGRTATWDIYCHSFMLGAIYFLVVAFENQGAQWKMFILSGIFMGLSFLGKGPVSFFALLLPFLISYIAMYRPTIKGKKISIFVMIVICLLISSWWTSYIYIFHKDMLLAVAGKESSSWLDHNVRPWYYYWQFPAEAAIWALFWVTSLAWFYWKKYVENKRAYLFSIIWAISSLVLLSIVPEKKTRYLLPMLIPGALNIAFYIYHCATTVLSKSEKLTFKINASLIALIAFALPVVMYVIFLKENLISLGLYISIVAATVTLAIGLLYFTFNKTNIQVMSAFYSIIGIMIVVEALCFIPIGKMFINDDRHSIHMLRNISEVQNLPFYHIDKEALRMELVYEANHIIRPLDISNDSLVRANLPFVLVSEIAPDSVLKHSNVRIKLIDTFDNNWRKRDSRHYNTSLVKHVSIISAADN